MSASSSEEAGGGDGGAGGVPGGAGGGGDYEGPSSSSRRRIRSGNGLWPEPFVEALAFQVAIDAAHTVGRLAAAQALFNLFQVCSTWRAISRSELLWQNLTRHVWNIEQLIRDNWREEYIYHHRTANNFRLRKYSYTTLHFIPTNNNNECFSCRRLAVSSQHLAAGFSNGAVRLFNIPGRLHISTFYPQQRDRLGRFSIAVSGIILSNVSLVFATVDGDIHTTVINGVMPLRRAYMGDEVRDGALVDFTGNNRWWVGLYAGVPGRAIHVWNSETEELVYIGGTLTDPEAVMGWHLLTEMTDVIGRIRVTSYENAVACTSLRVIVFDLQNQWTVLSEEPRRGIIVELFDANNDSALITDARGLATLRRVADLEEVCRFTARGATQQRGRVLGSVNGGYAVIFVGGVIRVWEIEHGQHLYSLRERIGESDALIADDRYVAAAAAASDGTIHVWDFGAQ